MICLPLYGQTVSLYDFLQWQGDKDVLALWQPIGSQGSRGDADCGPNIQ
jgi:hypothetical protein